MTILGSFKYYMFEIFFEGNDEETEYKVTINITKPHYLETIESKTQVYLFSDLKDAKRVFDNGVFRICQSTTPTDIFLYYEDNKAG